MTDYTELLARSKAVYAAWNSPTYPDGVPENGEVVLEQADAITALTAERDALRGSVEVLDSAITRLKGEFEILLAEVRNAALEEAAKRAATMEQYTVAAAIRALKDKQP